MLNSFKNIRRYLFHMGNTIVTNRKDGKNITETLIQDLHSDLLSMGLEEDQEAYLLELIDSLVAEVLDKLDAGAEIRSVLCFILDSLKSLIDQQESIVEEFNNNAASQSIASDEDDNIELF